MEGDLQSGKSRACKSSGLCDVLAQEMLFAGMQAQQPLPQPGGPDKYVALMSGLGVGDESGEQARLALLVDYLTGMLGGPPEQEQVAQACHPLTPKALWP